MPCRSAPCDSPPRWLCGYERCSQAKGGEGKGTEWVVSSQPCASAASASASHMAAMSDGGGARGELEGVASSVASTFGQQAHPGPAITVGSVSDVASHDAFDGDRSTMFGGSSIGVYPDSDDDRLAIVHDGERAPLVYGTFGRFSKSV
eukprot:Opistho-2@19879